MNSKYRAVTRTKMNGIKVPKITGLDRIAIETIETTDALKFEQ